MCFHMNTIYDFNKYIINYESLLAAFFFAILGFIFYFGDKLNNRRYLFRFFYKRNPFQHSILEKEDGIEIKYISKAGLIICIIFSLVILFKTYQHNFYNNYLEFFCETKKITGKVDSISKSSEFKTISFHVKNKDFTIFESGFISNAFINSGDSICITYFEREKAHTKSNIIIKIEK